MKSATPHRLFEGTVLNIACIIGAVRMALALYRDFLDSRVSHDLFFDIGLFVLFTIPLTLYKANIKTEYIAIPFSIVLGILISINWLFTGGIEGPSEYNMVALFFLFAMLFKGTTLFLFLSLLVLDQMILLYLWYEHNGMVQNLMQQFDGGLGMPSEPLDFVLMALAVTISLVYLKNKFDDRRTSLEDKKEELSEKSEELDEQNSLLSDQKKELEAINRVLSEKVDIRINELNQQNRAIEEYFYVSQQGINAPLGQALNSIDRLKEGHNSNPMVQLLIRSTAELKDSIEDVANKLKDEASLFDEEEKSGEQE